MAQFLFTQVQQIRVLTANQLPYKTGLSKLFKSAIVFNQFLAAADFAAIEADFSGYAALTETTLPNPYPDQTNGGVSFEVPTIQYQVADPVVVGNDIYGGWFESSAGVLLMAWQLLSPWPMQNALDALPLNLILNMYGSNDVKVLIGGVPQ